MKSDLGSLQGDRRPWFIGRLFFQSGHLCEQPSVLVEVQVRAEALEGEPARVSCSAQQVGSADVGREFPYGRPGIRVTIRLEHLDVADGAIAKQADVGFLDAHRDTKFLSQVSGNAGGDRR